MSLICIVLQDPADKILRSRGLEAAERLLEGIAHVIQNEPGALKSEAESKSSIGKLLVAFL